MMDIVDKIDAMLAESMDPLSTVRQALSEIGNLLDQAKRQADNPSFKASMKEVSKSNPGLARVWMETETSLKKVLSDLDRTKSKDILDV